MRVIWKGINETFRSVTAQFTRIEKRRYERNVSAMIAELEAATPVDTGFAASRWESKGFFPSMRVENDASYIERLNQGSSKQAPAFFVERIALRFGKPLGSITTVVPSNAQGP